jgi:hypothetical protein
MALLPLPEKVADADAPPAAMPSDQFTVFVQFVLLPPPVQVPLAAWAGRLALKLMMHKHAARKMSGFAFMGEGNKVICELIGLRAGGNCVSLIA